MTHITYFDSPIGTLTICAHNGNITGLWLQGQKHFPDLTDTKQDDNDPVLKKTRSWLEDYFNGKKPSPDELPIAPRGTRFQLRVWQELKQIPYGETVCYGQIAKEIGCPGGSQAVGGAVGRNPISIIVPCHRVIGSDGSLTGFDGGLDAKRFLLNMEQQTK